MQRFTSPGNGEPDEGTGPEKFPTCYLPRQTMLPFSVVTNIRPDATATPSHTGDDGSSMVVVSFPVAAE